MQTISIPKKEYEALIKRIEALEQDEILPEKMRLLERGSRLIEAGKGRKFKNMQAFRTYLKNL